MVSIQRDKIRLSDMNPGVSTVKWWSSWWYLNKLRNQTKNLNVEDTKLVLCNINDLACLNITRLCKCCHIYLTI